MSTEYFFLGRVEGGFRYVFRTPQGDVEQTFKTEPNETELKNTSDHIKKWFA